jgi:pyruvate/2-oxoglutarate dehydrogenase complex dihydrolipoamide acyltransferase (E2) component
MEKYNTIPWTQIRNDTQDFLDLAKGRNFVQGISEVDITALYSKFKDRKKKGIKNNSLTVYILWCYGQAIKKRPELQGIRQKNELVIFEDVDIAMMFEKTMPNGKKQPFPYIFRGVQNKSFDQLSEEMLKIKNLDLTTIRKQKKSLIIRWFPKKLRMFVLRKRLENAKQSKEVLGTVALTSLSMIMGNRIFYPLPLGPYPCTLAMGGVYNKPSVNGERKVLCLSICIDHDISDGAPVARFGNDLIALIENSSELI